MTSFAKRLEHLSSPEKRALLRQLLQQKLQRNGRETLSAGELFQIFDSFVVNVTQLSAEAVLDPTIRCDDTPVTPPTQAANVLLTGATGFLGAFLLHELLDQTGAAITCLVRAPDGETGKQRLLANLRRYLPETKVNEARIAVIPGDLAQPLLGLSPQDFAALAERVDVIYHNGAMVNWLYPYARLKPANVQGTQEVIRLAAQTRRKPLHYVSSLSVFPLVGNRELVTLYEETPLDHGGVLYGGYTQSKWVAEKLVAAAGSRGLPTAIYRPSLIIGHSQTGIWNSDDVVSRMLKSWVELNAAPDVDITLDMVPVDYVGGAIVHLSMCRGAAGDIYHLGNSHPVTAHDLTAWLTAGGYPLRSLPYKTWRDEMIRQAGFTRETALYSLGPLLALEVTEEVGWIGNVPRFDSQRTQQQLGSALACPPVDAATFHTYLRFFAETGFLPAPAASETVPASTPSMVER